MSIMNNNIKRRILRYETVKCDLDDAEILSQEYFEKFVNEVFPDQFNQPNDYIDHGDESKEDEEPEITENLRKIYKKLSLKVHPDKNPNLEGEEKIENEELFKEILQSYQNGNLCDLLVKLRQLRMKIPELSEDDIRILEFNIQKLEEKINRIKKQTSWVWCTTNDPRVKDRIREFLKKTVQESVLFDWVIEDKTDCAICLEEMLVGDTEKRIICGHIFHKECILSWFSLKFSCPLCRRSFE